jgi:hypothetical protein
MKRLLLAASLTLAVSMFAVSTATASTTEILALCDGQYLTLQFSNNDGSTAHVVEGGNFKVVRRTTYDSDTGQTSTTTYKSSKEPNLTCVYGRGAIQITLEGVYSRG